MKLVSILTLLALCVGCNAEHKRYSPVCGELVWYSPDKSLREAEQDCRECGSNAKTQTLINQYERRQNRIAIGMNDPSQAHIQESWFYSEKQDQFHSRMVSKGYKRIPINRLGSEVQCKYIRINNRRETIAGK